MSRVDLAAIENQDYRDPDLKSMAEALRIAREALAYGSEKGCFEVEINAQSAPCRDIYPVAAVNWCECCTITDALARMDALVDFGDDR